MPDESRSEVEVVPTAPPRARAAAPPAAAGPRARLLEPDDPAWSAFLHRTCHDVYHLPAYVRTEARHEAGEPRALLVEDGDRAFFLPLLLHAIPEGGQDAASPYGYPGPLVAGPSDEGFVRDAFLAGQAELCSMGIVSLFVRLHPLLGPHPPERAGVVVRHGETVAVDLTLPSGVLEAQLRRNHRCQIRQAREAGYIVRWDGSDESAGTFRSLYRRTMERLGAESRYCFGDAYFEALERELGDRVRLAVVEAEGRVIAGGLFIETCGIVEAHLTANDVSGGAACPRATKLMFHSAIETFKAEGARWLHLGGGRRGADDSLFHFKAGFSPLRFPFSTLRAVLCRRTYERLVARHEPGADPDDLSGFFPAYRRARSEAPATALVDR